MGAPFVCKGIFWRIFAICNAKMLLKSYSQTIPEFLPNPVYVSRKTCWQDAICSTICEIAGEIIDTTVLLCYNVLREFMNAKRK